MRVSLKSVLAAAAGLAVGAMAWSASAAPITISSSVDQSGAMVLQNGGPYPLTGASPYDYTAQPYNQLTTIDSIAVTLTVQDGDSGPGDFDFNDLTLGLDGIDTGLKLNGFLNNNIVTLTLTQLPVPLQTQILAALQADGKLVGTVIDADADGQVTAPDFIGFPSANGSIQTTLDITGQISQGGGGNVPLPAAVLLAPLGAGLAGIYSRRFRNK
jgi:hypothetical protein